MKKYVHAEIEYDTKDGHVHSDICPEGCLVENMQDPEYREFLHSCLEEWLNKSGGSGIFYIKGE